MSAPFAAWGAAHLAALALTVAVPLVLAALVRARPAASRPAALFLAALLAAGVLGQLAWKAQAGILSAGADLQLQLCDWAAWAALAALLLDRQQPFELAWFWGLGGTAQALLSPDLARGFPDPAFTWFFLFHGAIVAAALFMALGQRRRLAPGALRRLAAWTLAWAAAAGLGNLLAGANYGYLAAKPDRPSPLDLLGPWPWYLAALAALAAGAFWLLSLPVRRRDRPAPGPAPGA